MRKMLSWGPKTKTTGTQFKEQKKFLGSWNAKKGGGDFGVFGAPTPPPGGRTGSENDTLLPMTMTRDRQKFWNGPPWQSKVIIRKPWRRKNKKQENK